MENMKHVILTGPPGVGKTTLIMKICKVLVDQKIDFWGFYTEEVVSAEDGGRTGFKYITTNGDKGILADIESKSAKRVGKYGVEIEGFEKDVLPILENVDNKRGVLVVDEIGKMELGIPYIASQYPSDKFIASISSQFVSPNVAILATIPVRNDSNPIHFLESIRNHKDTLLFKVDESNRDTISDEILRSLLNEFEKRKKIKQKILYG